MPTSTQSSDTRPMRSQRTRSHHGSMARVRGEVRCDAVEAEAILVRPSFDVAELLPPAPPIAPEACQERKTERPGKVASAPSASSMRSSWLYFATRSEREGAPVLICPQPVA